jgi:hypothetical protein
MTIVSKIYQAILSYFKQFKTNKNENHNRH